MAHTRSHLHVQTMDSFGIEGLEFLSELEAVDVANFQPIAKKEPDEDQGDAVAGSGTAAELEPPTSDLPVSKRRRRSGQGGSPGMGGGPETRTGSTTGAASDAVDIETAVPFTTPMNPSFGPFQMAKENCAATATPLGGPCSGTFIRLCSSPRELLFLLTLLSFTATLLLMFLLGRLPTRSEESNFRKGLIW